jgi:DNA-directed RNA polymerase subunit beta'
VKDITQGLPRVEELFEAREPKGQATISELDGVVSIASTSSKEHVIHVYSDSVEKDAYDVPQGAHSVIKDGTHVEAGDTLFIDEAGTATKAGASGFAKVENQKVTVVHEGEELKEYIVPASFSLHVKDGDLVTKGQPLTEGNLNPSQIMELVGAEAAQKYIVKEVQTIYTSQGQMIHDKHCELIVRQMFGKLRVTDPGDSDLIVGDMVDKAKFMDMNEQLQKDGRAAAKAEQLLMGITKVSLNTDSFLAAASFQETTRVLIEAAVTGKTDYLRGLKENVIIGKLIPSGTGFNAQAAKEALEAQQLIATPAE